MTTGIRAQIPDTGLDTAAKYAALVSAVSSAGSLVLRALGGEEPIGSASVLIQTLAAVTIVVALGIYLLDWERKRDKWPGRLNEITRKILPVAGANAKYLPPVMSRLVILVYKEYYRMALAEGRKDLAKDFEKEIGHWEKTLGASESLFKE